MPALSLSFGKVQENLQNHGVRSLPKSMPPTRREETSPPFGNGLILTVIKIRLAPFAFTKGAIFVNLTKKYPLLSKELTLFARDTLRPTPGRWKSRTMSEREIIDLWTIGT
jgi:hypothetical protein